MSGLFPSKEPTGVWYRDHSLSLVIIAILISQTVFTLWVGHTVWVEDSLDHGASVRGHVKVPADGQVKSPLVASESPHLAFVVSAGS